MSEILIQGALLVNEGSITQSDVYIKLGRIFKIGSNLSAPGATVIKAAGLYLFPGCIDDQVHFREPGLTHKAEIRTEALAAVAGGITSYMEMPNTKPPTLTQELLEQKYHRAAQVSAANYSFYMGASNDNLEEVLKTNGAQVCGVKVFMGSSTGNMLVDDEQVLDQLFAQCPLLIATHCEDEFTVKSNLNAYQQKYGADIPWDKHPEIRSTEACYLSSSKAVALAQKNATRLHILHISTAKETELFDNQIPLSQKRITAEACIHHLWFTDQDYASKGSSIKWNPAVKSAADREGIWEALTDGRIDVIATDHAPHTWEEKQGNYLTAPSGGPLVQHALMAMMDCYHQGQITLPQIAQKMAHNPAVLFRIKHRGFIREGYHADLVLVDPTQSYTVNEQNILSKCGWSPFNGHTFKSQITHTLINGQVAYQDGQVDHQVRGDRLTFEF